MAGILRFNVGEVRKIYNHSMAAKEHFETMGDLFEPKYHKGGKVVMLADMDFPDGNNIDNTLIPASLCLVRDRGVYLMSNGLPRLLVEGSKTSNVCAYAEGADPKDDGWWDIKRSVFGGDDGAENLPLSLFSEMMEMDDEDTIKISVSQRSIKIIAEPKKSKAKLKP